MKLNFCGETDRIIGGVELLKKQLGFSVDHDGVCIKVGRCEKGFVLSVKGDEVKIDFESPCDFYRALAIAADALKKGKDTELSQSRAFDTCGVMIDVSRRAVMKPETVKMLMRYMAAMGMNRLMLYTEDIYEIPEQPYFGYMRGRYTKAELQDIVIYGKLLGIECVPCIQTLAHLERPLRWDAFKDVRNTPDCLLIGEEKTYEFIEQMIKAARECYLTDEIHIGMDEAFNLNMGRYLELHGYRDRLEVLCEHMHRVNDIVGKYGFEKPMMWGDMFLRRIITGVDDKLLETMENIPEDMAMVYWSYDGRSESMYRTRFDQMALTKRPVIFAGGIHTWDSVCVNYTVTLESSQASLGAAKTKGIKNVFATMWGDNGTECDITSALLGFQLYSEINYNDRIKRDELYGMFRICTGFEAESFLMLDCENYHKRLCPEMEQLELDATPDPIISASSQVLYQNPLFGLFEKNLENADLKTHYMELCERFETVAVPEGFEELFENHGQLLKVLLMKCDIGERLKAAYDSGNKDELSKLAQELDVIAEEISKLYDLRAKLWYKNNKPFGFEAAGGRLMSASGLCRNAASRVKAYIDGYEKELPELSAQRLYFNSDEHTFTRECGPDRIMIP